MAGVWRSDGPDHDLSDGTFEIRTVIDGDSLTNKRRMSASCSSAFTIADFRTAAMNIAERWC
ncbi:MAG: hypothetical protein R3E58_06610 [Phycisphaerae bacterium]